MKFAGFALLAAGLAFVFHAHNPSKFDHATPLVVIEAEPPSTSAPVKLTRNFSIEPAVTLKSVAQRAESRVEASAVVTQAVALPQPVQLPVAVAVGDVNTAADDGIVEAASSKASLIRRIKRELRRVGCYGGRVDSDWDRESRSAMGTFMDRVNATLPSQEPDVVLLNLVRNHKSLACGATCPRGQAMNGDGKCLPNAIIAKLNRKAAVTVARATPAAKPFTTTVTINEVKPTAAILPPPRPPVQIATKAPLPGRMAMGGPVGTSAKVAGPEKSWWDNLIDGVGSPEVPVKEQTLDRPVGLTHVPQPRLVRRVDLPTGTARIGTARPDTARTGTARQQTPKVVMASTGASDGFGATGSGDGTALSATELTRVTPSAPSAKPSRTYRKAAKSRSSGRQKYARRWSGRSTQAMFQHPLGRM